VLRGEGLHAPLRVAEAQHNLDAGDLARVTNKLTLSQSFVDLNVAFQNVGK